MISKLHNNTQLSQHPKKYMYPMLSISKYKAWRVACLSGNKSSLSSVKMQRTSIVVGAPKITSSDLFEIDPPDLLLTLISHIDGTREPVWYDIIFHCCSCKKSTQLRRWPLMCSCGHMVCGDCTCTPAEDSYQL